LRVCVLLSHKCSVSTSSFLFFLSCSGHHRHLHSFPTRRSSDLAPMARAVLASTRPIDALVEAFRTGAGVPYADYGDDLHEAQARSEEHTSELQSRFDLVCRLLLEKKKKKKKKKKYKA